MRKSVIRQRLEQAWGASMPRPRRGQEQLQGKRKDAGFLNTRGHVLMGSLQLRDSQMRVHTEHGWKMAGLQVNGHKEDSAK